MSEYTRAEWLDTARTYGLGLVGRVDGDGLLMDEYQYGRTWLDEDELSGFTLPRCYWGYGADLTDLANARYIGDNWAGKPGVFELGASFVVEFDLLTEDMAEEVMDFVTSDYPIICESTYNELEHEWKEEAHEEIANDLENRFECAVDPYEVSLAISELDDGTGDFAEGDHWYTSERLVNEVADHLGLTMAG